MSNVNDMLEDIQYMNNLEFSQKISKTIKLPHPSIASLMKHSLLENETCLTDWVLSNKIGTHYLLHYCSLVLKDQNVENIIEILVLFYKVDEFISEEELKQISGFIFKRLNNVENQNHLMYLNKEEKKDFQLYSSQEHYTFESLKIMRLYLKPALEKSFTGFLDSQEFIDLMRWLYIFKTNQIDKNLFIKNRILGRGGFGEVYGCIKIDTAKMYAMKVLYKQMIKDHFDTALNEKNILSKMNHQFLICMPYAYTTNNCVTFILDLMLGGDLSYNLEKCANRKLSEADTRFYLAEVTLGLEYMHKHKMVYHDLKPENILLDKEGHTKISDFGLTQDLTHITTCGVYGGTLGFMAPEILNKESHDHNSDWFSFGVMMYVILVGSHPFIIKEKKHKSSQYSEALKSDVSLDESIFSNEARDLFLKLVERDPKKRICANSNTASELKAHPFFKDLNWNDVFEMTIKPPIIPCEYSINAHSSSEIGLLEEKKNFSDVKLTPKDHQMFDGFEYKNFKFWQAEVMGKAFESTNAKESNKCFNSEYKVLLGSIGPLDNCIVNGYLMMRFSGIFSMWKNKHISLFSTYFRLVEIKSLSKDCSYLFSDISSIELKSSKKNCFISINMLKSKNIYFRCTTQFETEEWMKHFTKLWYNCKNPRNDTKNINKSNSKITLSSTCSMESSAFKIGKDTSKTFVPNSSLDNISENL